MSFDIFKPALAAQHSLEGRPRTIGHEETGAYQGTTAAIMAGNVLDLRSTPGQAALMCTERAIVDANMLVFRVDCPMVSYVDDVRISFETMTGRNPGKDVVIVLDEFDRCSPKVQQYLGNFVNRGRVRAVVVYTREHAQA